MLKKIREVADFASQIWHRGSVIFQLFLHWCVERKGILPPLDAPINEDGKREKTSEQYAQTLVHELFKLGTGVLRHEKGIVREFWQEEAHNIPEAPEKPAGVNAEIFQVVADQHYANFRTMLKMEMERRFKKVAAKRRATIQQERLDTKKRMSNRDKEKRKALFDEQLEREREEAQKLVEVYARGEVEWPSTNQLFSDAFAEKNLGLAVLVHKKLSRAMEKRAGAGFKISPIASANRKSVTLNAKILWSALLQAKKEDSRNGGDLQRATFPANASTETKKEYLKHLIFYNAKSEGIIPPFPLCIPSRPRLPQLFQPDRRDSALSAQRGGKLPLAVVIHPITWRHQSERRLRRLEGLW